MSPDLRQQALTHHRAGRLAEAEAIYRRLLAQSPRDAGVWNNLGEAARGLGRADEAIAAFDHAIALARDHVAAHLNRGLALTDVGRLDEAAQSLRRAIALKPDYAKAHASLGRVLHALRLDEQALAACREAVRLDPRSPACHNALGNVLRGANRLEEAVAEFQTALKLKPDHVASNYNLGEALAREGEVDAAIDCYRRALSINHDYMPAHQALLFTMHYSDRFTAAEIFAAHRTWSEKYETPLKSSWRPHDNDRSPDRRLRVGYVSPDFRRHPIGYFMRPIFAHHDPQQVEMFVYNGAVRGDGTTDFFRSRAHGWRDTYAMSDEALAEQIRADRIDILVDLTLHMAGSRLLTFARKPAPVQATYLGYAHSTGLSAMDYKITDPYLDPPGMSEQYHTEQTVRLPDTNFCCEPEPDAPPVGDLPARTNGYITFASFNTLMKTNAAVIETWARVLVEVPAARLMIVAAGLADAKTQDRVRERFTDHGVEPQRLELADLPGVEQGLRALTRADIALDTFPYAGGTTTCNALWMGVPVITLAGTSPIARQGVSFLTNVGLPEFITTTRDQYVASAAALARDLDRLARVRASLRDRMRRSAILDGVRFVRNLEQAYRQMWRKWCENPDPA